MQRLIISMLLLGVIFAGFSELTTTGTAYIESCLLVLIINFAAEKIAQYEHYRQN